MANDETEMNQDPVDGNTDEGRADDAKKDVTEEKKFSQAEVDEMISKRLAKEKSIREREDAKKEADRQKQAEIDKLDGEEKLRAQFKADLEKVKTERAEAQRELRVARAGVMLGKHGLDTDFAEMMAGETDEETQARVDKFAQIIKDEASKMSKASLSKGAPPVPNGGTPKSEMDKLRDEIFESAGLEKRK